MTFKEKIYAAGFKTQADFARSCRVSERTVRNWIKGEAPHIAHKYLDRRILEIGQARAALEKYGV